MRAATRIAALSLLLATLASAVRIETTQIWTDCLTKDKNHLGATPCVDLCAAGAAARPGVASLAPAPAHIYGTAHHPPDTL